MKLTKNNDLIIVFVTFIILGFIFYHFKVPYLIMGIVYFGLPSAYLAFRNPKYIRKALIESVLWTIPVVTTLDYIATKNNAWLETTVFNTKVLDVIPLETYSWSFFFLFLIIITYDSFFDRYSLKRFSKNIKKEIVYASIVVLVFALLLIFAPHLIIISKFYIWLIVLMSVGVIVGLFRKPKLISRVVLCSVYLFIPWMIHEIVALQTGQWSFDVITNYIGSINIGGLIFPLEEFAWWIIVVPLIIVLHEYFADNNR